MNFLYNCFNLWCNGCSFLCPLQKQQWKFSHLTQSALGNSHWGVVLSSLGHQLGSNVAWCSGFLVHCNITAIGFVWQVGCKALWGYLQILTFHSLQQIKYLVPKKAGNKWGKSKQQNCKAISLCVCLWRSRRRQCRKKVLLVTYWCVSVYNGFYISHYTLKGRGSKKLY